MSRGIRSNDRLDYRGAPLLSSTFLLLLNLFLMRKGFYIMLQPIHYVQSVSNGIVMK